MSNHDQRNQKKQGWDKQRPGAINPQNPQKPQQNPQRGPQIPQQNPGKNPQNPHQPGRG